MSVSLWTTHDGNSVLFAVTVTILSVMVAGDVSGSVAQHITIKILCNEDEKAAYVHHCPQLQFEEHILLCSNGAGHSETSMNVY
jgi:hypothetical protein